jgi:hypothetical protein
MTKEDYIAHRYFVKPTNFFYIAIMWSEITGCASTNKIRLASEFSARMHVPPQKRTICLSITQLHKTAKINFLNEHAAAKYVWKEIVQFPFINIPFLFNSLSAIM